MLLALFYCKIRFWTFKTNVISHLSSWSTCPIFFTHFLNLGLGWPCVLIFQSLINLFLVVFLFIFYSVFFFCLISGSLAVDLVTISHRRSSSGACCGGNDILACYSATVQVENLGQDVVHLPGSIKLNLKGKTPGNSNGYHYESSEGDAVLTLNPKTKGLHGHAQTSDGHSYVLEYCGANGHVWKLMDIGHMAMEAEVALELPVEFKVWWFIGVDRI